MTHTDSAPELPALKPAPERADALIASEYASLDYPGLEDVDGAARGYDDECVVVSDIPVTVVGRKRGGGR